MNPTLMKNTPETKQSPVESPRQACLAPAIVWLARAVKVERPFALRLHHLDRARFARDQTALRMARLETARLFKSGVNRTLQWKVQLLGAHPSVLLLKLDGTDFML